MIRCVGSRDPKYDKPVTDPRFLLGECQPLILLSFVQKPDEIETNLVHIHSRGPTVL